MILSVKIFQQLKHYFATCADMTPLDYLKQHCKIKVVKESYLHKIFVKHKNKEGCISGKVRVILNLDKF